MLETTRGALETYDGLVRRYRGRLEDDLELCWDSDTLAAGDGGMDIRWLCDQSLAIESMPAETCIALTNYDRLVRIRGYVALPNDRVIYTHGPDQMRMDWDADVVVFEPGTDVDEVETVSFDDLCQPWPGVPYATRPRVGQPRE
jgi:hypothetical protein